MGVLQGESDFYIYLFVYLPMSCFQVKKLITSRVYVFASYVDRDRLCPAQAHMLDATG